MACVAAGAQLLSARKTAFGRQRSSHWISLPSLPLPSSATRFQRLRYPPISLSAAVNPPPATLSSPIRLYVSGLSFRTTEESLRNAFEQFGQLTEVNLVMDKIANRPRGFAFLRYSRDEAARKAVDGMHGKGMLSRGGGGWRVGHFFGIRDEVTG